LASWLADLAQEQEAAGDVAPFVVSHVLCEPRPAAAWGDAATVVRSLLHERFGDLDLLRDQFASIRAWTDLLLRLAGERHLWEGDFQYGDWLDPTAPPEYPAEAKASQDLVATADVFRSRISPAEPPSSSATRTRLHTTPGLPRRFVGRSWPST
jgi:alpha-L-rhamnosidase